MKESTILRFPEEVKIYYQKSTREIENLVHIVSYYRIMSDSNTMLYQSSKNIINFISIQNTLKKNNQIHKITI